MGDLVDDLEAAADEFRETHISWVFLHRDYVYKVKRPVVLDFLDFSTMEQRRRICQQEVELNQRLAPGVYLGVVPVQQDSEGTHRIDGTGKVVDWAVKMRRLPDERRLDHLLQQNKAADRELTQIAERLVDFHREAPSDEKIKAAGHPDRVLENLRGNFSDSRPAVRSFLRPDVERALMEAQVGFVQQHRDLFLRRMDQGKIRDGHGDLKVEHVYLEERHIIILDCIEFKDAFRYGDVAVDLAFLSMDLRVSGYGRFAEHLLAHYALLSNDYDIYALIEFYESYRAAVKASVTAILAEDEEAPEEARRVASEKASCYFAHLERSLPPKGQSFFSASESAALDDPELATRGESWRPVGASPQVLVLVVGLIASGKSTVAAHVSSLLSAPIVSSDRTRKYLAGVSPTTPLHEAAFAGAYSEEFGKRVYGELMRRADLVLRAGRPVIVDASFRSREQRARLAELARGRGVPFRMIECHVPEQIARERLRSRERELGVSDGRAEIYDQFVQSWEPIEGLSPAEHSRLDTLRPEEQIRDVLRSEILQEFCSSEG